MSGNETEAQADPAPAAKDGGGGLLKGALIAVGLFVLMSVSQIVTPLVAGRFMPAASHGSSEHGDADDGEEDAGEPPAPPQYLPMDPPFVVSFEEANMMRFLQISIQVMARDEATITAVQEHNPVIRNNLLMLLGGQSLEALHTREEKERLRGAALAEVQAVLVAQTGEPGVEDLYFTSFVVQ